MRIVRSYAIQDGDLTTNATESVAAWSSVTAYTTGQTVSYGRKVWEAVQNGTNKQPDISPLFWFELRPTNPWAMFDNKTGTQTVRADDLTVTVDVDGYADTVGLLNISASSLNVKVRAPTPERTNLVLWSEDFSNPVWITDGVESPDDQGNGAWGITADTSTGNHFIFQSGFVFVDENTFTIEVKSNGTPYLHIEMKDHTPNWYYSVINLADGDTSSSSPALNVVAEPLEDGWFRLSGALDYGSGASTSNFALYLANGPTFGDLSYTGDGVSGVLVRHPQAETGATSTEYIPTTSVPASSTSAQIFNEDVPLVDETAVTDYYEYFFEPIIRLTDVVIPLPPDIFSPSITVKLEDAGEDVKAGHMIVGKSRYIGEAEYGATIGIIDYSRIEEDDFGNTFIVERGYNRRGRFNVWITSAMVDAVYNIVSSYRATPIMIIATEKYNSTLYFGLLREAEIEIAYPNYSIMSVEVRGL